MKRTKIYHRALLIMQLPSGELDSHRLKNLF